MAKGGRSRSTKRPIPVVKRAPALTPLPKSPTTTAATAAMSPRSTASDASMPVTPAPTLHVTREPTPVVATPTMRKATTPPLSPTERWISAFTRGFPYVLTEYCLFLLAIFAGPAVAISVGAVLVSVIGVNYVTQGKVLALLPATVVHEGEALLGQRDDVLISLGIIGVGLLSWSLWHFAGIMLFSWLAIIALLAALFLLFYAQRIQTPRET